MPVVFGEPGSFYTKKVPEAKVFNAILFQMAGKHRNIEVVSSKGLNHKVDTVHFDAAAQREFGKRCAEKLLL
ncbi:MAG: sialate O-acetylesterase [Bacteroidota bacterium]|nr:sialate O-acetylesterase [Bacteroidota bacterium]MDP4226722.1 sialate O-acetylesterase [Bacteroidota bacterium]MDP4274739.1 sialate O-acetylesterase [Bacteroidota bacterium]